LCLGEELKRINRNTGKGRCPLCLGEELKRINRNTGKGRCPFCLGEEGYKHILLDCYEAVNG